MLWHFLRVLGLSSFLLAAFWVASGSPNWISASALGLALLVFFRPNLGVGLFLLTLGLFGGDYPGSVQNSLFYPHFSGLTLGLVLRWIIWSYRTQTPLQSRLDHPVVFFILTFVLSGILSLSGIPWDEIWTRWIQLGDQKLDAFLKVKELWVLYPFLRQFHQIEALAVFLVLLNYPKAWGEPQKHWLIALLGGLSLVMIFGFLDFYGWFSLSGIRPIATGLNTKGLPLRLQSFFGHPAWCAIFMSATIPSVLVILSTGLSRITKMGSMLVMMIVGEYLLVLTFARGGWISYPFTLLAIWFCIHVLKSRASGPRMWAIARKSAIKILVSIPITVILTLGIIAATSEDGSGRYVNRFKSIAKTVDRTVYIKPSLEMTMAHPFLGGGTDSFAYRYAIDFVFPTGRHYAEGNPLGQTYNNAHSTYLQILTGQGLVGLLCYLSILVSLFITVGQWIRFGFERPDTHEALSLDESLFAVITLCATVALTVYGIFDDIFYAPSITTLFFLMLGIGLSRFPPSFSLSRGFQRKVQAAIVTVFLLHLQWEYGIPGETRAMLNASRHTGCYSMRDTAPSTGEEGHWCSERFDLELPVIPIAGQHFALFKFIAASKKDLGDPIRIRANIEGEAPLRLEVLPERPLWLIYPIKNSAHQNSVKLTVASDNGVMPLRDPRILSLDRRWLALLVLDHSDFLPPNPRQEAVCRPPDINPGQPPQSFCETSGTLPKPYRDVKPQDLRLRITDPLVSSANPNWIGIIGNQGGIPQKLAAITDHGWHPLVDLIGPVELKDWAIWVSRPGYGPGGQGSTQFEIQPVP